MKLRYFAWVRERIGKPEEELEVPAAVTTVGELVAWLAGARRGIRLCFREPESGPRRYRPRACQAGAPIAGACEIAFFPPMTGG